MAGTRHTARGDKDQRCHDVLTAAAAILVDNDWNDFSIREVASRAEVSLGAVYQWFDGKEEIFAAILSSRLRADTQTVQSWRGDLPLEEVVSRLIELLGNMHAEAGRHRFGFVASLQGHLPDYALDLKTTFDALRAAVRRALTNAVANTGHEMTDIDARMSWFWSMTKGVSDHLSDDRYLAHGTSRDQYLQVSTTAATAGLLTPLQPGVS